MVTPILRGINVAGAEFGTAMYDSDASFAFYKSRGVNVIRWCFAWVRAQPTVNGALDENFMLKMDEAVNSATSRGMVIVLDNHNYARRSVNGTPQILGDGVLTKEHLADFWSRMATRYQSNPLVEYGLMNEPYGMPAQTQTLGANGVINGTFETDVTGWQTTACTITRNTTTVRTGVGSLQMTATSAGNIQAAQSTIWPVVAGSSYRIAGSVRSAATSRTSYIQFSWINSAGANVGFGQIGFVPSTTTGWTNISGDVVAPAGAVNARFSVNVQNAVVSETHYWDDISFSSVSGIALSPEKVWEAAAQASVNAIRATGDTNFIRVAGYDYSSAANYWTLHPTWWIVDAVNKSGPEGHYYFDENGSGGYANTFATVEAHAIANGYLSVADKVAKRLKLFTDGCTSRNVRGYIGEIGWPNGSGDGTAPPYDADVASWNAAGEAAYDQLDLGGVDATYWASGEAWGNTSYWSPYRGSPASTLTASASIIEAHYTSPEGGPMATLQQRLNDLITSLGTDYKSIWANTGLKANLNTTSKATLVDAINEVNSKPSGTGGASILDSDPGTSTTTAYSASKIKALNDAQDTAIALKAPIASPTFTGTVSGVTKAMVGLANVDNTADTAKPVSTAQATALALKANTVSPAFTGTPTGITSVHVGLGNVDNTSDLNKPLSTAEISALALKAPLASPAFTGTPTGITAAHVGLGNVTNTSDANKPVSTAQAAAIAALIADASATNATTTTYSASKINTAISAAVASLVNGSAATLDTLAEIATALGNDANFATTITTALGNRVRFDAAQTLTAPQKVQAKANIDAFGALEIGNPDADLVAAYAAAKA